ncbi:2Fe-2S iron-sulfur cluster binding domain-containing protein [Massilia atriviolacea]|uniref:2Fe-2S iron-sulfur cluster binding domain-containing protein n=1 Tax=Massilia atriviolacea TaxID=2495579 RepID=A0A430HGI9_9BURK|nr:2Fe-2S iron-sulfur cluster-binding protein [Massilia atriviolacea]RSZ56639.1 2Fe-2S iron-sulfur cluster binding domain-containing protein [Massilia atriviolacea]
MNTYWMTVQPGGWRCEVAAGVSLLAAAEAAGIALPSSCRNGTCRTCLCRVLQGEVAYRIDWPGLSADEKRAGDVLPCVALARSDLVLLAPAARRTGA